MDVKPKKIDKKLFGKLKDLGAAITRSKDTPADTKALETASKEVDSAANALAKAMDNQHKAFEKAYNSFPDVTKTPSPSGPVPIPYPNFGKVDKEIKGASKVIAGALKKHEKAQKNLVKVIDKQIKVLKPAAKSSGSAEAATMKSLVSAKTAGKAQWASCSVNVKIEGQRVARFLDLASKHTDKGK
ncbi:MAG: PAAR-like domain-containing protein [Sulfitobacter sp.]